MTSRRGPLAFCALVACTLALSAPAPHASRAIPDRLDDTTFWRIVSSFSEEPLTGFPSENFVSNESEWQYVIPAALERFPKGAAYLGVGPEQNFTYIAAFKPKIAFICDIRRQNLIQHLMYKALFEMSTDRADFLSKLWARKRPDGLDSVSDAGAILAAFRNVQPDSLLRDLNIGAIFSQLVGRHKFALTSHDSATLRAVYNVFVANGPDVSYSSSSGRNGSPFGPIQALRGMTSSSGMIITMNGTTTNRYTMTTDSAGRLVMMRDSAGTFVRDTSFKPNTMMGPVSMPSFIGASMYPTFGSLMTETDGNGINRGWMGSDSAFKWLKGFEQRNLLVPVVGDFAGPSALRNIGDYLRSNNVKVGAFYTSNVEQYLFQNRVNAAFYENVGTLPTESNSFFIRSFANSFGIGSAMPRNPRTRLAQTTSGIEAIVRAHRQGELMSYQALARAQDQ